MLVITLSSEDRLLFIRYVLEYPVLPQDMTGLYPDQESYSASCRHAIHVSCPPVCSFKWCATSFRLHYKQKTLGFLVLGFYRILC